MAVAANDVQRRVVSDQIHFVRHDTLRLVLHELTADPDPGIDLGTRQIDVLVPGFGQTAFALSKTPLSPLDVSVTVNGLEYVPGVDFSVSGTTLTWNDVPFSLDTGDSVLVDYQF